jgi:hypothetical protein
MGEVISATTSLDHPSPIESTSGIQFRWLVAVAPAFTFATCYLRDFVLPHVPVMSWNDQMLFATDGARIVAGQMPYRDYFQFVTPGIDLVRYLAGTWGYTDEHLRPFEAYLDHHYRPIKTFPAGFEVWERTDTPQPDREP